PDRNHPRQHDGSEIRSESSFHFREPERQVVGGDPDVAGEREFGATAERVSEDGRDHRLRALHDRLEEVATNTAHRQRVRDRTVRSVVLGHLGEIAPGAERTGAFGAQHHDPDIVVVVRRFDGSHQLLHQRVGQRVQPLRPVQRDGGDVPVDLDDDLRAHRPTSAMRASSAINPPVVTATGFRSTETPATAGPSCIMSSVSCSKHAGSLASRNRPIAVRRIVSRAVSGVRRRTGQTAVSCKYSAAPPPLPTRTTGPIRSSCVAPTMSEALATTVGSTTTAGACVSSSAVWPRRAASSLTPSRTSPAAALCTVLTTLAFSTAG